MSLAYPWLLGDATIKFEHFWWVIAEAAKPSILPFNYLTYHHHHKNSSNKQKLPLHIPIILFHAALAGYSALGSLCLYSLLQSRKKEASWYRSHTAMALKHTDREGSGETLGLLLWLWEGKREWVTGSLPCYEQRMTDTLQTGFNKRSDSECLRSCFVMCAENMAQRSQWNTGEHLLVSVTSMSALLPQTPPSPNGRSHLLEVYSTSGLGSMSTWASTLL